MLKLLDKKGALPALRRCPLTAGQRVSRRYRRANIRRIEYRRLKAIVPSIADRNKVTKVEVIEEAIKYIDELHKALYARLPLMQGGSSSSSTTPLAPHFMLAQMFRSTPAVLSSLPGSTTPSDRVSSSSQDSRRCLGPVNKQTDSGPGSRESYRHPVQQPQISSVCLPHRLDRGDAARLAAIAPLINARPTPLSSIGPLRPAGDQARDGFQFKS